MTAVLSDYQNPVVVVFRDIERMLRGTMTKVLITGCSKGIGYEAAVILARTGYEVVATMRTPANCDLEAVAADWEIPLKRESSVWPSVAGLVPPKTPVIYGIGPVARDLGTPQEAVQRISLIQRTLLLAEFLLAESEA